MFSILIFCLFSSLNNLFYELSIAARPPFTIAWIILAALAFITDATILGIWFYKKKFKGKYKVVAIDKDDK